MDKSLETLNKVVENKSVEWEEGTRREAKGKGDKARGKGREARANE